MRLASVSPIGIAGLCLTFAWVTMSALRAQTPSIEPASGGGVEISVPADDTAYGLESSGDLRAWDSVLQLPILRAGQWFWFVPGTRHSEFFRLRRADESIVVEAEAPPLDETRSTSLAEATAFLFSGPRPLQVGAASSAMEPTLACVLRGRVKRADGTALAGVQVSVHGFPEFGVTITRQDGRFDLVTNGGRELVVRFTKSGFCQVDRTVSARIQDYHRLADVVLVPQDAAATVIEFGEDSPFQVHEASGQSDASGQRRCVLLFQPGTTAEIELPDGSVVALPSGTVRVTEFTVGDAGPEAMPAALPGNSLYTYCAEFSFDEAEAMGAVGVRFNQPVVSHVDNFLDFPVGIATPVGTYDESRAVWVADYSGRIIRITGHENSMAAIDIDGDGVADDDASLAELGIGIPEREELARLYPVGRTLWRTPLRHFTTKDINWPGGQGGSASGPPDDPPQSDPPPEADDDPPGFWVQSQRSFSSVPVAGTPFSLHYDSSRTRGYAASRELHIPLTGDDFFGVVDRIEMEVDVAGRAFLREFEPGPGLSTTFQWDGLDAYGRRVQGAMPATVRISYLYPGRYNATTRFALNGLPLVLSGSATRDEVRLAASYTRVLGGMDLVPQSIGGWTLNVHHAYDPVRRQIYLGDGSVRGVENVARGILTSVGAGQAPPPGYDPDGVAAEDLALAVPWDVAVGPDGSLYVGDASANRILRIDRQGQVRTVAGSGVAGYSGDGGPATSARINSPYGIDVGPDGSVYFCDFNNHVVRRVGPDGIISTVAGSGIPGADGDDGPATAARLRLPIGLDLGPDGTLFIADTNNHRIRAVSTEGIIRTIAGTGSAIGDGGYSGDGGPAIQARLNFPLGVAADVDGTVYIGDTANSRIRRVRGNGTIDTIAGDGSRPTPGDPAGDGGPASQARLHSPTLVKLSPSGDLVINDPGAKRVRLITRSGLICPVAGSGMGAGSSPTDDNGDGGAALRARLGNLGADGPQGIAVHPDGSVLIADTPSRRIRRVGAALPTYSGGDIAIPSVDGRELHRFDKDGRHLETLDTLTGESRYTFQYDVGGRLVAVVDGDGLTTTIDRDQQGRPTAITSAFGRVTTLAADENGCLASMTDPVGRSRTFTYDADGLLLSESDHLDRESTFAYDSSGRVVEVVLHGKAPIMMERAVNSDGLAVTLTLPATEPSQFLVERGMVSGETRTNTDPAGLVTVENRGIDDRDVLTLPDGTRVLTEFAGDPRFGLAAPLRGRQVVTLPGGESMEIVMTRTTELADRNDRLSLTSMSEVRAFNGKVFESIYDPATRTHVDTTPEGRTTRRSYDHVGRLTEFAFGGAADNIVGRDESGRAIAFIRAAGGDVRAREFTYEGGENPATIVDPLGRVTRLQYTAAGELSGVTLPGGQLWGLGYDANGNLDQVRPPEAEPFLLEYSASSRLESFTAPDAGGGADTTRYRYNDSDRLVEIESPDGSVAAFVWDGTNRLVRRTMGGRTHTYEYSPATGHISRIVANDGAFLSLAFNGGVPVGAEWGGDGHVQGEYSRELNDDLQTARESVNGANPVEFTYDADGLMTTAGILSVERTPDVGRISRIRIGQLVESLEYNAFGEIVSQTVALGDTVLMEMGFEYDALGRLQRKVESISGDTRTLDYEYDASGRLSRVLQSGAVIEEYSYDPAGNLIGRNGLDGAVDAQGRLISMGDATYDYSRSGVLKTKSIGAESTSYSYDQLGGLRGVTLSDGRSIEYRLDGANRRVGKAVDGVPAKGFLYRDGFRVVAELDAGGSVASRFVYLGAGTVPAYMVKGSDTFRMIYDLNGSLRLVVRPDDGQVAQRLDYDAFGRIVQDTNPGFQPFAFGGGIYDPDTGLVRCGARDYDAEAARWTSRDPILFLSDDPNLYAYVRNSPHQFYDPLGAGGFGFHLSGVGGYGAFGPWSGGQGSTLGGIGGFGPNGAWGGGYTSQSNLGGGGFGADFNLLGGGIDFTNAGSKCDFESISDVHQFDILIGTITYGTGGNNGTNSLSVDLGLGLGAGFVNGTSSTSF